MDEFETIAADWADLEENGFDVSEDDDFYTPANDEGLS